MNSPISGEYKLIPIRYFASQSRKGQSGVELLQLWQSHIQGGALLGWRENVHCGAGRSERERKLYARSGKY